MASRMHARRLYFWTRWLRWRDMQHKLWEII
jgi:hypothetical protein